MTLRDGVSSPFRLPTSTEPESHQSQPAMVLQTVDRPSRDRVEDYQSQFSGAMRTSLGPPRSRGDFKIAIICALPLEADAVHDVLDQFWDDEFQDLGQANNDMNTYTAGAIGNHHVVIAHMPEMGNLTASMVAGNIKSSFTSIELALIVGVCGGVPMDCDGNRHIYLGDLIISSAVVQYDHGRQYDDGFEPRDTLLDNLGRPNQKIRGVLSRLETRYYRQKMQQSVVANLSELERKDPSMTYPGASQDQLFKSSLIHKHRNTGIAGHDRCHEGPESVCDLARKSDCKVLQCVSAQVGAIARQRGTNSVAVEAAATRPMTSSRRYDPEIHIGIVGCGNTVMKSGVHRDRIAGPRKIIAFEMEGAGVWEHLPTVIIKGVCDYADSHKNKLWQKYAAGVAAVGTKAFLKGWVSSDRDFVPGAERSRTPTTVFNNHGPVKNLTGTQTIHGNVVFYS